MKNSSCHDARMEAYCKEVRCLEDKFFGLELNHVARRYNEVGDELVKIASGRTTVPPNVFARDIYKPLVIPRKAPELAPHDDRPRADGPEAMQIDNDNDRAAPAIGWWTPRSSSENFCADRRGEGVVPTQPFENTPTMYTYQPGPGAIGRNPLGGLRAPRGAPNPRRQRL
jgi:hypothetical protein